MSFSYVIELAVVAAKAYCSIHIGAKTNGAAPFLHVGSTIFLSNSYLVSIFSNSLLHGPARYKVKWAGCVF